MNIAVEHHAIVDRQLNLPFLEEEPDLTAQNDSEIDRVGPVEVESAVRRNVDHPKDSASRGRFNLPLLRVILLEDLLRVVRDKSNIRSPARILETFADRISFVNRRWTELSRDRLVSWVGSGDDPLERRFPHGVPVSSRRCSHSIL